MTHPPSILMCSTCRIPKVPDDFHRNRDPKNRSRGYRAYTCRQCYKDRDAAKQRRTQQPPDRVTRDERVNIRVTPELKRRLEDQSDRVNKTQSLLVSEALDAYLTYLERKPA